MSDTMTLQAVVDSEFRSELLADPAAFGMAVSDLPAPVEQPDQGALDLWMCDGTTK